MKSKHLLPSTVDRVAMHTSELVNQAILNKMEHRISYYMINKGEIPRRLGELNREWDIERALELLAGTVGLKALSLGRLVNKNFYFLLIPMTASLLMHATIGWCPPSAVLRRLGFRTSREIEAERVALKAMRGDFEDFDADHVSARTLLMAADPTLYRGQPWREPSRYLTTPLYM